MVKACDAAGGQWCVGYPHTESHWERYREDHANPHFYVIEGRGLGIGPWLAFTSDDYYELRDQHDDLVDGSDPVYKVIEDVLGVDSTTFLADAVNNAIDEAVAEVINESVHYDHEKFWIASLWDGASWYAISRPSPNADWDLFVQDSAARGIDIDPDYDPDGESALEQLMTLCSIRQ